MNEDAKKVRDAPRKQLNLLDATCIIVGIIVGAGIYESTPLVASLAGSSKWLLIAWVMGGLLAFCGALCYAELSTMFPHQGGDYVYLSRAYHSWFGTFFVWIEFWIIRPGNIGAVAFVLARYFQQLLADNGINHFLPSTLHSIEHMVVAVGSVTLMTGLNLLGIQAGKWTQNVLTIIKIATLLAIFLVALLATSAANRQDAAKQAADGDESAVEKKVDGDKEGRKKEEKKDKQEGEKQDGEKQEGEKQEGEKQEGDKQEGDKQGSGEEVRAEQDKPKWLENFALAMVFVMFSYGGWGDMTYVAAEVRDPRRNLVRALVFGTLCVMLVYILVSIAFLRGLGYERLSSSQAAAADFLGIHLGRHASLVVSLAIGISCLGCIHGMVFAGSRVYYALGTRNSAFSWLGRWNTRTGVPSRALLAQYLATTMLVVMFGWGKEGFTKLVIFTGPFFWGFFAFVGLAVIVMRIRMPERERPYRVHLYPLLPLIFSAGCFFMLWMSTKYVISQRSINGYSQGAIWAVLVVGSGILLVARGTDSTLDEK